MNVSVHGGGGAAAGAAASRSATGPGPGVAPAVGGRGPTQNELQGNGLWGVRGPQQAGSVRNPVVMVLEASKYTPMGSYAAAIGESDATDAQRSGSSSSSLFGDAAALDSLRGTLADLSQNMSAANRLAAQGQQGLAAPGVPAAATPGGADAQTVALQQAADALSKIHGDMTSAERERVTAPKPSPTQASSQGVFAQTRGGSSSSTAPERTIIIDDRTPIAGAAGGGRGGSGGGPPVAAGTPPAGGSGGGGGWGGPSFSGPSGGSSGHAHWNPVSGSSFHTHGSGEDALSFANLFRGDGGHGGAFGLPSFGSIGSLGGLGLEHVVLSGLGIGASATSAVGGASLLGAASLSQMAVGGGADALINKDTVTQAKNLYTNVQALNKAIAVYGAGSKQATLAQYALNQQWKELGGGAGKQAIETLDQNAIALQKLFDKESAGARVQSADLMDQALHLASSYVPLITAAAQKNLGIINTGLKPLFSWLEGPQGMGIIQTLENAFARDLPTSLHAVDMAVEDFLRLMGVASQYTGGLATALDKIFTDKNRESTMQYDAEVRKLVGDLHEWEDLLKLLGEDLEGIFKQDAGTANSIVLALTAMLQKLHDWEESSTGQSQLKTIFAVHKQEILELLQVFERLGSIYGNFYMDVAPPLVKALTAIAGAMDNILSAVESLPGGADLLGLVLVLGKLGALGPALRAVGGALGIISKDGGALGGAGRGAGGAALPAGVYAGGEAVEGAEADATLASRALPVVGASGIGLLAGTAAQGALGLKGGMGATLGGAAAGGGIGFLIGGPLGAGIGAGIGSTLGPSILHVLGGLFGSGSGEDYGKKFAQGWIHPFQGIVSTSVGQAMQKVIKDATDKLDSALKPKVQQVGRTVVQTPATSHQISQAQYDLGRTTGQQFVKGLGAIPNASTGGVLLSFTKQLQGMPAKAGAEGKAAAAQTMLEYAQELQSQGKLPKDALAKIIPALEAEFPQMTRYLNQWGVSTNAQVANALKLTQAQRTVTQSLGLIRNDFVGASNVIAKTITPQNLFPNLQQAMQFLQNQISTSTGTAKQNAITALTQLRNQSGQLFDSMVTKATGDSASMKNAVSSNSKQASQIGSSNFQQLAKNIANYVGSGAEATGKGLQNITAQVNAELKQLGQKGLSTVSVAALSPAQLAALVTGQVSAGAVADTGGGNPGHATGAKVNTPMYMVGEEGAAHPEFVLATNPAYRQRNLGLWTQAGKELGVPGFAGGGVVGEVSSFMSRAGFDKIAIAGMLGNAMQESSLNPNEAGGGFWQQISNFGSGTGGSLEHQMEVMLPQILGLRTAMNAAKSPGQAAEVFEEGFEHAGIIAMANRMQYAQEAYEGKLGSGLTGAAGAGAALQQILAPSVKGKGPLASLAKGALGDVAKAANSYLSKFAPAVSSAVGGGGAGPTFPVAKGKVPAEVQWALSAAESIVGRHPAYGHEGAGWGLSAYDCSSFVSTVMDAAGIWPKWAYYTAADPINEHTLPGPGKWITIATRGTSGNDAHTMMEIDGKFFESSHFGLGPHVDSGWSEPFDQYRHPRGFASGGMMAEGQPGHQPTNAQAAILGGGPSSAKSALIAALNPGMAGASDPRMQAFIASAKSKPSKPAAKTAKKPKGLEGIGAGGFGAGGSTGGVGSIIGAGGAFPFSTSDLDPINNALSEILRLDGGDSSGIGTTGITGKATDLWSLIDWYTNTYWTSGLFPSPNFSSIGSPSDFVISQDAFGNPVSPYVSGNINEVVKQLSQAIGWQDSGVGDLKGSLSLSQHVVPAINKAIRRRVEIVKKIRKRINDNLKQIAALQAKIKASRAGKRPYAHPKGKSQHAANAAFEHNRKGQISGWQGQITKLEAENAQLGGDKSKVGGGGELGQIHDQLGDAGTSSAINTALGSGSDASGLYQLLSTVTGWESTLGGTGGDISLQQLQLGEWQQNLSGLVPGADQSLAATLASGTSASSSGASSQMASLLEQQLQTAGEALAVSQAQYGVLANLPPFGGSFATGGMVPGPVGAARTIIAHGGEIVSPVGGVDGGTPSVHLHFAKGMEWIGKFVDARIEKSGRSAALTAGRKLPGRGGGILVPGR